MCPKPHLTFSDAAGGEAAVPLASSSFQDLLPSLTCNCLMWHSLLSCHSPLCICLIERHVVAFMAHPDSPSRHVLPKPSTLSHIWPRQAICIGSGDVNMFISCWDPPFNPLQPGEVGEVQRWSACLQETLSLEGDILALQKAHRPWNGKKKLILKILKSVHSKLFLKVGGGCKLQKSFYSIFSHEFLESPNSEIY